MSDLPRSSWLLRIAAALVLLTGLAWGGAELHLRSSIHPPAASDHPYLWAPLHRLKLILARDVPGLTARTVELRITAQGLRGEDLDLTDQGARRVLTLGGSVTECLLLEDGQTWPDQLGQRLRASGQRVWVGNAGKSGQSTIDYAAHARVLVPAFRPELVLVLPGGNDLQVFLEDRYFPVELDRPEYLERFKAALYTDGTETLEELQLGYTGTLLTRWWGRKQLDGTRDYEFKKQRRYEADKVDKVADLDLLVALYRANLEDLVAALLRADTRVLLLTHPYQWAADMTDEQRRSTISGYSCEWCPDIRFWSADAMKEAMDRLNAVTLAVCEETEASCYDLESRIPKTLEYFYDDAHLTRSGAGLVADQLGAHIIERGLLP